MTARAGVRAASRSPGLCPESILDAALVVARREGVEGLSIRKLAAELRVSPMAVYHHFASKEAILLGVIDRVVGEAAVTGHAVPRARPRPWLQATFRRIHAALVEQPGLIPLLGASMRIGPSALAVLDEVLGVLRAAGLDAHQSVTGFHTLMSYTLGAASLRVGVDSLLPDPRGPAGAGVAEGASPLEHVDALRDELIDLNARDGFDDGLDVVLAGLQAAADPAA